jgi:hypothetical protein
VAGGNLRNGCDGVSKTIKKMWNHLVSPGLKATFHTEQKGWRGFFVEEIDNEIVEMRLLGIFFFIYSLFGKTDSPKVTDSKIVECCF